MILDNRRSHLRTHDSIGFILEIADDDSHLFSGAESHDAIILNDLLVGGKNKEVQ